MRPAPWLTPEAAELLASCKRNPPATVTLRYRFRETRTVFTRADRRVARLREIFREQTGESGRHEVQDAIADAVAGRGERRAA